MKEKEEIDIQYLINQLKGMIEKLTFKKWLTEKQVQDLIGKKTTSLWKLRRDGKLQFSKIGNKIFYNLESIEKLLEDNFE